MTEAAQFGSGCPYCGAPVRLRDSAEVYKGRSYGPAWICSRYPECDAYVGCHPNTTAPLGRLADAELRRAKIKAHAAFDAVWQERLKARRATDPKYSRHMARGGRYKRLAELLGIARDDCHIGMFDVATCERVVELCQSGALN